MVWQIIVVNSIQDIVVNSLKNRKFYDRSVTASQRNCKTCNRSDRFDSPSSLVGLKTTLALAEE